MSLEKARNQGVAPVTYGEGNFKALFETMELDQVRRGVLGSPTKGA